MPTKHSHAHTCTLTLLYMGHGTHSYMCTHHTCGHKRKTEHLYLFLPSCKGAPPWCADHGFLFGSEVLGERRERSRGAHWPASPPGPHTAGTHHPLTWSLVFSDSDELSEFSSSDGDTLA